MSKYAEKTSVSADRSRAEIEKILLKYNATGFVYGWNEKDATIGFRMSDRSIRFILKMPARSEFNKTKTGRQRRHESSTFKAWEQSTRQRWRALCLVVKAKLEAVETGITTFEEEFMAHIVLPGGKTVGEEMLPQVAQIYSGKKKPLLLPGI